MWNEKKIICADCFDELSKIPDNSFDSIIIDPPYGYHITSKIKSQVTNDWDVALSQDKINTLFYEFRRVCTNCVAIFGTVKSIIPYLIASEQNGFTLDEHIVWVKRVCTPTNPKRPVRKHENIFLFKKKNSILKYYKINGRFDDLWVSLACDKIISMSTVIRHLAASYADKSKQPIKRAKRELLHNDHYNRFHTYKIKYAEKVKEYQDTHNKWTSELGFSTIWSFLATYQILRTIKLDHASIKPYMLLKRLVEFITPPNGSVLDCFAGSCGIALVCEDLNMNYLCIEKDKSFIDFYEKRKVEHLKRKEIMKDSSQSWINYLENIGIEFNPDDFEHDDET